MGVVLHQVLLRSFPFVVCSLNVETRLDIQSGSISPLRRYSALVRLLSHPLALDLGEIELVNGGLGSILGYHLELDVGQWLVWEIYIACVPSGLLRPHRDHRGCTRCRRPGKAH